MAIFVTEEDRIALRRFAAHAAQRNLREPRFLGSGQDGVVHEADSNDFPGFVAVKTFYRAKRFEREKAVYRRLREMQVARVKNFNVPQLIAWNDDLLTIEMTVVSPPCILDFAEATLDEAPEFSDEVWVDWNQKLDDDFGERALEVRRALAILRSYGVILLDVHPGNVRFE